MANTQTPHQFDLSFLSAGRAPHPAPGTKTSPDVAPMARWVGRPARHGAETVAMSGKLGDPSAVGCERAEKNPSLRGWHRYRHRFSRFNWPNWSLWIHVPLFQQDSRFTIFYLLFRIAKMFRFLQNMGQHWAGSVVMDHCMEILYRCPWWMNIGGKEWKAMLGLDQMIRSQY